MNGKRIETRWKRHCEKRDWKKEAEEVIEKEKDKSLHTQKNSNLSKARVL